MCSHDKDRSDGTAVDRLGREITELASHIHAATCRWLGLVAEFDRRQGWGLSGCKSCAHWISWRCSIASSAAREHVRVAHRLEELPRIRAAFAEGRLSYSKVRALARVENVEDEDGLLNLAEHATAAQLEKLVRAYRGVVTAERVAEGGRPLRYVRWEHDDDGALLLRARLPVEEGEIVLAALEATMEELRAGRRSASAEAPEAETGARTEASAGPDAPLSREVRSVGSDGASAESPLGSEVLSGGSDGASAESPPLSEVLLGGSDGASAESPPLSEVLSGGSDGASAESPPLSEVLSGGSDGASAESPLGSEVLLGGSDGASAESPLGSEELSGASDGASAEAPTGSELRADALVLMAETVLSHGAHARGGDRFQVVLHVEAETLAGSADDGRCELADGAPLAAETARRLACDAAVVPLLAKDGRPLSVGRKTRSVPPALRRALASRDRGCRFPGCTNRCAVDAHHIHHWARGGPTSLDNLVQLCRHHHRLLHEGGYTLEHAGSDFIFRRPDGAKIRAVPRPPKGRVRSLRDGNGSSRRPIDPEACVPRSGGERMDLGLCVDAMLTFAPAAAPGI
jgi:hypothetical protein